MMIFEIVVVVVIGCRVWRCGGRRDRSVEKKGLDNGMGRIDVWRRSR